MRRLILSLALMIGLGITTLAQSKIPKQATFNYGKSVIDEMLPEGFAYNPLTFLAASNLFQFGAFSIYNEMQFTQAYNPIRNLVDYEVGLNAGLKYHLGLTPTFEINASIASGPHFISVETRRQADGFIFSDNVEVGFSYFIPTARTTINAKARFRHISNAGLQSPNGGIDNLFVVIGIGSIF